MRLALFPVDFRLSELTRFGAMNITSNTDATSEINDISAPAPSSAAAGPLQSHVSSNVDRAQAPVVSSPLRVKSKPSADRSGRRTTSVMRALFRDFSSNAPSRTPKPRAPPAPLQHRRPDVTREPSVDSNGASSVHRQRAQLHAVASSPVSDDVITGAAPSSSSTMKRGSVIDSLLDLPETNTESSLFSQV